MSLQALTWAISDAPVDNSTDLSVLVAMAERADSHGRDAFESIATLAYKSRNSERTVQRSLARMETAGLVKLGNQAAAAYIRADRRPVVYDLCLGRRRDEPLPPSVADAAATWSDYVPPESVDNPANIDPETPADHTPSPNPGADSRGDSVTPRADVTKVTGCQMGAPRGDSVTPEPRTKPTTYRTPNGVLPEPAVSGAAPPLFEIESPPPPPPLSGRKSRTATKPPDPIITASQQLASAYYDRVGGFCNHPAVAGVVRKALRAGEPVESIAAALERLADSGRPVTTDTLRIECRGMEPTPQRRKTGAERMFDLARTLATQTAPGAADGPVSLPVGGAA